MSSLSSLQVASYATGFISFGFTFLTLLRLTWNNLQALVEAPSDIKYAFANLRSALHEERKHLRRMSRYRHRRRSHSGRRHSHNKNDPVEQAKVYLDSGDGVAQWRVINDTVKKLCRQFQDIEKPFLTDAASNSMTGFDAEKEDGWREDEKEYVVEGYLNDYSDMTLYHRFLWLWKKGQVCSIRDSLARVQIRRMAQEVTATWLRLAALEGGLRDLRLIPGPQGTGSDATDKYEADVDNRDGYDRNGNTKDRTERVHVRRSYQD